MPENDQGKQWLRAMARDMSASERMQAALVLLEPVEREKGVRRVVAILRWALRRYDASA